MYHDSRGRLSAHHTLLSNMYHDNRDRHSAHHTLLPNMYHDNRGRQSAYHTLPPIMYHDDRGRLSPHHTLLTNIYHFQTQYLTVIILRTYKIVEGDSEELGDVNKLDVVSPAPAESEYSTAIDDEENESATTGHICIFNFNRFMLITFTRKSIFLSYSVKVIK